MASNVSVYCTPFDSELETIQEFFQRFQCQSTDLLHKFRNDENKKASLLLKSLPVGVITNLQRRLSPTLLSDATFDVLEEHLIQQFSVSKSTIGASVQFLNYHQQSGQSLEEYARTLNVLASQCNYPSVCLDRLLRDTFVAGIYKQKILQALMQVCDKLNFRETVERAKLLETFQNDADKIHSSRSAHVNSTQSECHASDDEEVNEVKNFHRNNKKKSPRDNYLCYRCGTKGQHFSDDCYAKHRTCHSCHTRGHISKICQKTKKSSDDRRGQENQYSNRDQQHYLESNSLNTRTCNNCSSSQAPPPCTSAIHSVHGVKEYSPAHQVIPQSHPHTPQRTTASLPDCCQKSPQRRPKSNDFAVSYSKSRLNEMNLIDDTVFSDSFLG